MKRIWIVLIIVGLLGMAVSFPWPNQEGHTCLADRLLRPVIESDATDRMASHHDFLGSYGLIWMVGVLVLAFGLFGLLWGWKQAKSGGNVALLASILFLSVVNPAAFALDESAVTDRLDLESLISEAVANNPEIQSAREAAGAAEELIAPAGALPDPTLGFQASNVPLTDPGLARSPMTGLQWDLTQAYPFPGKLRLKRSAAERQAAAARIGVEIVTNRVVADLKRVYYDLALNRQATIITEKNKGLLEDLARIARVKYSVGSGLQQDVLKSQVAVSRFNERLFDLEEERETLVAELNSLLHRPPTGEFGPPDTLEIPDFDLEYGNLESIALKESPSLRQKDEIVKSREAMHRLAGLGTRPDFNFGLGYRLRAASPGDGLNGADFFTAFVTVKLPLYYRSKQVPETRSALRARESARMDRESAEDVLLSRVKSLYERIGNSRRKIDLYRQGILPEAAGSLESARAGYQVDKVDFLTLLNNQSTLYDYEIRYYRVLAELNKQLVDLEELLDVNLDELKTGNQIRGGDNDEI